MSNTINARCSELVHANGAQLFIFFFSLDLMEASMCGHGMHASTNLGQHTDKCELFPQLEKTGTFKRVDTKSNPK